MHYEFDWPYIVTSVCVHVQGYGTALTNDTMLPVTWQDFLTLVTLRK